MQDTRRLTQQQAEALVREWQDELGLRDWTILVAVRRSIEIKDRADVNVTEEKRCGFIRLRHPDDGREQVESKDMEADLVHELFHIALAPFLDCEKGSHKDIVQEQSIHAAVKTAVAMKRELRVLRNQASRKRAAP